MADADFTAARLRELLNYNPETGVFVWRCKPSPMVQIGASAGSVNGDGYTRIKIAGRSYRAHRLAWMWVTGAMPAGDLDHINGNRADNRIANLRLVSRPENQWNMTAHRDMSPQSAVGTKKRGNKWQARIRLDGKVCHLGMFNSQAEARGAYLSACKARSV